MKNYFLIYLFLLLIATSCGNTDIYDEIPETSTITTDDSHIAKNSYSGYYYHGFEGMQLYEGGGWSYKRMEAYMPADEELEYTFRVNAQCTGKAMCIVYGWFNTTYYIPNNKEIKFTYKTVAGTVPRFTIELLYTHPDEYGFGRLEIEQVRRINGEQLKYIMDGGSHDLWVEGRSTIVNQQVPSTSNTFRIRCISCGEYFDIRNYRGCRHCDAPW